MGLPLRPNTICKLKYIKGILAQWSIGESWQCAFTMAGSNRSSNVATIEQRWRWGRGDCFNDKLVQTAEPRVTVRHWRHPSPVHHSVLNFILMMWGGFKALHKSGLDKFDQVQIRFQHQPVVENKGLWISSLCWYRWAGGQVGVGWNN